jgi:hypothetical protein
MSTELLIAIATLCQVTGVSESYTHHTVAYRFQVNCQKEYVRCLKNKEGNPRKASRDLADCILERNTDNDSVARLKR